MQTSNYGINGSDVNELGQRLPPMQVIGKHEPWGHMGRSAERGLDAGRVLDLVDAFFRQHGRAPAKYFSPDRLAITFRSFRHPEIGLFFLDITHDNGPERVE